MKNNSSRSRKIKYSTSRYWNFIFTERYKDGSEKDFKTIILAKSYLLATAFLKKKVREDNPSSTIKGALGYLLHSKSTIHNKKLGVKEWSQIRAAAFPNENNVLFKLEKPRPPGNTNRWNSNNATHLKNAGFKKGKNNWNELHTKGTSLPAEARSHMIYQGKWKEWDPELRKIQKDELIGALIKCGNCRSSAAKELNVGRHRLYALLAKFPEVDWAKEYPIHSKKKV